MADVHSKEIRSFNMSRIKSKNTKPELLVRRLLFAKGFRFRLHIKTLCGKPDIVLKKYKTAIFVHGCFWHGHKECRYFVMPKTRTEWWANKILGNQKKDEKNTSELKKFGWNVIEVYECELKKEKLNSTMEEIFKSIYNQSQNEISSQ